MASNSVVVRHLFGGGWSTDYGPTVDASPDQSGKVLIPYLVDAQDCVFELDGGPHEIGGTSKVNASAVESGAVVTGLVDYWRQGTAGAPARRRVIHAGTKVLADADNGIFASTLFTGLALGAVPSYFTFDDLLVISSDSTADAPKSWDQTTTQNLAGTPPRFSFGCAHKNRAWAAGNFSAPSRLYYSANTDPEDWVGAGSGSIDIDPNDGDIITGIASHKDELIVFKGPNKGSIHRITGASPSDFARKNFVKGIGAAWHNAIFPFADDLGFVSQYGTIHSLSATAAYGDFFAAALSRPINGWLRDHLNYNRLRYIWGATDPLNGRVYITMSIDANSTNNFTLIMDYRNAPDVIRWSYSTSIKMASLALFVDTSGRRRILGGSNDGFVKRLDVPDRSIDGSTALSFKVTTPFLNYGNPMKMKTGGPISVGFAPKGNFSTTFGWTRDNQAQQSVTLMQGGSDVLGTASANQFTLDTSTLAGGQYVDRFHETEEFGEFRSVQYQFRQSANYEDIELHSFSVVLKEGAISTENSL